MSSESSTESENPCEKEGDCVDLPEVLVIGKKKSSNPYDNANVAANAQKLYSAIDNTPATKDIDKNMLIAFSMVNPFQKIMNDYQTEGEVDPWDVAGMIPVFRIYKITKYGTIIEKTLPVVDNRVLEGFAKHAFAKGKHSDLGLSIEKMISKGGELITNNAHLLKEGDNTLVGNINGIQKSFVKDGQIMSINMYPGTSNRITRGLTINFGNIKW